jgi:hypothetical protein
MMHSTIRLNLPPARAYNFLGLFRADPAFFVGAITLFALMVPTTIAALLDSREFQGVDIWDKPLKFQFALGVYLITLSLYANLLTTTLRENRWFRLYGVTVLAAIGLETVWITGAAALGLPSHFNTTETGSLIYRTMGGLALWLTGASMVYGILILRGNAGTPILRYSVAAGLILTLPLTAITAGYMSVQGSHWVGGDLSDASGLVFMGWSRTGGDLRVAHFFATHALHIVPLASLLLAALIGRKTKTIVLLVSAAMVALVAYTFTEALGGRPFLSFLA